ncbi:GNAT family N-acetyltransferase [Saccharopolyspora phatthalungensis]|uniref:GNAT superfamily N-acetyltransferase n=1 Tax=Saccharopolyspora phatthalungensis TaxID=664693 RepID=A0A840Q3V5_9PSEU|nr:GNAT family N-acetyltransferase [Saccharopolyspora phatthalungensis]MBB5155166.1 GNAT superfamily N-acetyltransferase [Saccharopolyspora phatthalungensis]
MSEHVIETNVTIAELGEGTVELAYPAMKELRPHLADPPDFVARVRLQQAEGYRLIGSFDASGAVVAAAGFRLAHSLAWGRYLYIDDLSTLPAARRQGHARALLRWINDEARRLGCEQLHLDSGTHRHDAHRRYLSSGFIIPALHFSKSIPAK